LTPKPPWKVLPKIKKRTQTIKKNILKNNGNMHVRKNRWEKPATLLLLLTITSTVTTANKATMPNAMPSIMAVLPYIGREFVEFVEASTSGLAELATK
jgi:hypothetical protein